MRQAVASESAAAPESRVDPALILALLSDSAARRPGDAKILGEAASATTAGLHGATAFSNEPHDTLRDVAQIVARGEVRLVSNSSTYHTYRSEEPTAALLALKRIVAGAGIECAIERQCNLYFAAEAREGDTRLSLERLGFTAKEIAGGFAYRGGPDAYDSLVHQLIRLKTSGVKVLLWPALVANRPYVDQEVRTITHLVNSLPAAELELRRTGVARALYNIVKAGWPATEQYTSHPEFPDSGRCHFEIAVARRSGEQDRISLVMRFPEGFPLQSTQYSVNIAEGTFTGSDTRVLQPHQTSVVERLARAAKKES